MTQAAEDQPNFVSTAVEKMLPAIKKMRDVTAGWSRLVIERATYLPQHPAETGGNYKVRYLRPTFFNALARTVKGLTGIVFRRDPVLNDDVPAQIREHWENIDNQGTSGDVFSRQVFRDATEAGHSLILVDMPSVDVETLEQEQTLGIRPYWVHIKPEQVRNFRSIQVNGQTILEQITIKTITSEKVGLYGDKLVTRYRTFTLTTEKIGEESKPVVQWVVHEESEGENQFQEIDRGVLGNVRRIPIAVAYGEQMGFMTSVPPLENLADLNILNFQTSSDYHHAQHIACVPMLAVIGADSEKVTIGPNATLDLPEEGDAKWIETSGNALGHSKDLIQEQKADMATMGLNMLAREKRAAETAAAKRIDKGEADSALATIARSLEDAENQALAFHAEFMGLPSGGTVAINRDYEAATLTPAEIDSLSKLNSMNQLSTETMWTILEEGEVLPDDFDADVEKTRIEGEIMVGVETEGQTDDEGDS